MNQTIRVEHGRYADPDDAMAVRVGCCATCTDCQRSAVVVRDPSVIGRRLIAAGFATASDLARAAVGELLTDCPTECATAR